MKNIAKSVSVAAAAAVLLCSAGCSGDTKWAFKTDTDTLKNGQWIYYTFDGVNDALTKIKEEKTDADIDTVDWGSQEIEGKSASDWIYAEAKDKSLRYLTMEKLARENDIVISEDTFNSNKTYYSYFYKNYYKTMFEALGVSEDSYCTASLRPELISDELFKKIYGKGGTKEVADKDVEKYFVDNYVAYYYLSCDLKQTDDNGNKTDLDDATLEKYRANFRKYVNLLNNDKKTVKDVSEQYKTDFEVETAPETNESKPKDDMTDSDLDKAILEAKENVAVTKEIDDKLYLIYRFDTKSKVDHIHAADEDTGDDTEVIDRDSIVKKMKNDEYEKYLKDEQNKVDYERNDACVHKYNPERTIDILKSQSGS